MTILLLAGLTLPLLRYYTDTYFCVLLHDHSVRNHTCISTLLHCLLLYLQSHPLTKAITCVHRQVKTWWTDRHQAQATLGTTAPLLKLLRSQVLSICHYSQLGIANACCLWHDSPDGQACIPSSQSMYSKHRLWTPAAVATATHVS